MTLIRLRFKKRAGMSNVPSFAQLSPSLTASPFGNLGAATGTIATRTFNGSYTGTGAANPQTIPFLPKMFFFNKGPGSDRLVVLVDVALSPPTGIAVLTGAPTFIQFTGTTGISATSFDPQALDTLTSLAKFNTSPIPYNYWILG